MTHWFDSHCHLDFPDFDADREALCQAARAQGVTGWLIPGVAPDQWPRARALAESLAGSLWAAGLHPWWLERQAADFTPEQLVAALAGAQGCAAIGECGLDGALALPLEAQLPWLRIQLAHAHERGLPVILHQVQAHNALLRELKKFPRLRGLVHGFAGSLEMARDYLRCGLLLGIGGVVTHDRAARTRATLRALPADGFVLETDAPSMPLAGEQGRRNVPQNLLRVAACVADLRGETLAALAAQMDKNLGQLFGRREPGVR